MDIKLLQKLCTLNDHHRGGKCELNPKGWEVGWTRIEFNEMGQSLFNRDSMRIHEMHRLIRYLAFRDEVTIPPPQLKVIASTCFSKCQAMYSINCFTIQSHPEFTSSIVKEIMKLRLENKVFHLEQVQEWNKVVDQETDGLWFLQNIIRLLSQ